MSLKLAWSTKRFPDQLGLSSETLSQKRSVGQGWEAVTRKTARQLGAMTAFPGLRFHSQHPHVGAILSVTPVSGYLDSIF